MFPAAPPKPDSQQHGQTDATPPEQVTVQAVEGHRSLRRKRRRGHRHITSNQTFNENSPCSVVGTYESVTGATRNCVAILDCSQGRHPRAHPAIAAKVVGRDDHQRCTSCVLSADLWYMHVF